MNRILKLLTIGIYLVFNASFLIAGSDGTIRGIVENGETGKPLTGVQVYLEGHFVGAVSDNDGFFAIEEIKPGTYTVIAEMLGFDRYVKKGVKVGNSEDVELNITLSPSPIEDEGIIVTASKMNKAIEDIPAAVYVLDKKILMQTSRRNIEEVFELIPGVNSIDRFHSGYNYVSFRGVGLHSWVTKGVMVMIDGIPVNEAMGRMDFEQLDLDNAKSIEIMKGPVSALYGPNAFSGAINVVTNDPSYQWNSTAEAMYGSFNTRKGRFGTSGRLGNVGISLNATYYAADGYMERNSNENYKISSKFRSDIGSLGSFILSADYVKSETEWPGNLTEEQFKEKSTVANSKYTGSDKDFFMTALSHTKYFSENSNIKTSVYYRNKQDDYGYSDRFRIFKDYDYYGFESKYQSRFGLFGGENDLITGVSFTREDGRYTQKNMDPDGTVSDVVTSDGRNKYDIYGFYIQDDYSPVEPLTFSVGLRYDVVGYTWDDYMPGSPTSSTKSIDALNPRFSVLYKLNAAFNAYANIGKGFNPPESDDLFVGNSRYNIYPNPNLKPQYLTNYEIGFKGRAEAGIAYQLALFYMDFSDQIETVPIPNDPNDAQIYENLGNTTYKGIELSVKSRINRYFNLTVIYSYLNAKFDDYPDYAGNYIRKTPQNQGTVRLDYQNSLGFWGNISAKFYGEYYMDNENINTYEGYTVVNLRMGYSFSGYFVRADINNLLDNYYASDAYASYSYRDRQWLKYYTPAWPFNISISFGVNF